MIKLAKVTTVPTTLAKNTMYLVKNSSDKLEISLTDSTGASAIGLDLVTDYNSLLNKPDVILTTSKGVANGVAELDSSSKIPASRLPDSILGQLEYQGPWNMATALPVASSSNKGWYYIASNATVANGYVMGDWAVSNGTSWDKIDNTDAVQSVAGRTGAVSLTTADLSTPLANKVSSYTLVAADRGTKINTSAAIVINSNVFSAGDSVIISNTGSSSVTVTIGAGLTCYMDGDTTAKTTLTLVARGLGVFMFDSATVVTAAGKSLS